ncbi:hypothetical protein ABPG74_018872, partial [Tetrahymena malaccensis]
MQGLSLEFMAISSNNNCDGLEPLKIEDQILDQFSKSISQINSSIYFYKLEEQKILKEIGKAKQICLNIKPNLFAVILNKLSNMKFKETVLQMESIQSKKEVKCNRNRNSNNCARLNILRDRQKINSTSQIIHFDENNNRVQVENELKKKNNISGAEFKKIAGEKTNLKIQSNQNKSLKVIFNQIRSIISNQNDKVIRNLSQCQLNKLVNKILLKKEGKLQKFLQKLEVTLNNEKVQLLGGSSREEMESQEFQYQNDLTIPKKKKKYSKYNQLNKLPKEVFKRKQIEDEICKELISQGDQLIEQLCEKYYQTQNIKNLNSQQLEQQQQQQQSQFQQLQKINNNLTFSQQDINEPLQIINEDYQQNSQFNQNNCNFIGEIISQKYEESQTLSEQAQQPQQFQIDQPQIQNQKAERNIDESSLKLLMSIFKIGDHINSGGEADIYAHPELTDIAYRIICINDSDLEQQLQELINIKQFQQEQSILGINVSHLVKDKKNQKNYIIHIMQKCQMSLKNELKQQNFQYTLSQFLKIIFDNLNFLIALRIKYIYHSDIKPDNILKEKNQYFFSDFGISQMISFFNPFNKADSFTEYYLPKQIKNRPFYHDIFSIGKVIELLLKKLVGYDEIKKSFENLVKELCCDDDNYERIDCFQLPNKFINALINSANLYDQNLVNFFEDYLKQVENHLVLNKESKIFKYEPQYQQAEIALQIVSNKNLNMSLNQSRLEVIKLKALQTKCLILFKRKDYGKSIDCIKQILANEFQDQNCQDTLISTIRITIKLLLKFKINFSENNQDKLQKILKTPKLHKSKEMIELQIKMFEFQLYYPEKIQRDISEFLQNLENRDESEQINTIYKLIIKQIKYLAHKNVYRFQFYNLFEKIYHINFDNNLYYYQKLLKKIGLYLYKYFYKNNINDIQFYHLFKNEILILPKIICKYFLIQNSTSLEISFDKDAWKLFSVIQNIQQNNHYYEQYDEKSKKLINDLILKYDKDIPSNKTVDVQKQLPYIEYEYFNQIFSKFNQKQQQDKEQGQSKLINLDLNYEKYENLVQQINSIQQNLKQKYEKAKVNDKIINQSNKTEIEPQSHFQCDFIQYFDSEEFTLEFIGSQQQFISSIDSFQIFQAQPDQDDLKKYLNQQLNIEKQQSTSSTVQSSSLTIDLINPTYINKILFRAFTYYCNNQQVVTQMNLKLSDKSMSQEQISCLTSSISKLKFLKSFKLSLVDFKKTQYFDLYLETIMNSLLQNAEKIIELNLNFEQNEIEIESSSKIRNIIEKFINLKSFTLILNPGHEGEINHIALSLSKLKNLTELNLYLDEYFFDDSGAKYIADILLECQNINIFSLQLNHSMISFEGVMEIVKALESCQNLSHLTLYLYGTLMYEYKHLVVEGIANSIIMCQNLTHISLDLKNKDIGSEQACFLANALLECQKITSLNLYLNQNNLDVEGTKHITKIFKGNENITKLTLSLDQFTINDEAFQSVSQALGYCPNISDLTLYFNKNRISSQGVQLFAQSLQKLQSINKLYLKLEDNYIGSNGIQIISNSLENCQNIKQLELYLEGNKISSEQAEKLQKSLNGNQNIKLMLKLEEQENNDIAKNIRNNNEYLEEKKFPVFLNKKIIKLEIIQNLIKSLKDFQNFPIQKLNIRLHQDYSEGENEDLSDYYLGLNTNSNDELEYQFINQIFVKGKALTELYLDLQMAFFFEQYNLYVAEVLTKYRDVNYLNIEINEMTKPFDKGALKIIEMLKKYPKLTHLSLSFNQKPQRYFYKYQIANYISKDIDDNISKLVAESISNTLTEHLNLQQLILKLNQNSIGSQGANYIGQALIDLKNLENLSLGL